MILKSMLLMSVVAAAICHAVGVVGVGIGVGVGVRSVRCSRSCYAGCGACVNLENSQRISVSFRTTLKDCVAAHVTVAVAVGCYC